MLANRLPARLFQSIEDSGFVARCRRRLADPAWRKPALVLALLIFAGGAYWSFRNLAISPAELDMWSLAILAALTLPSLVYGGIGVQLLARGAGLSMTLGKGTMTAASSYLAELLPLPGGAIVRTGALLTAGATLRRSTSLVVLTAVLWVALAMIGAGLTLLSRGPQLSLPLLAAGSAVSLAICGWLWATAGAAVAVQTLVHRCAGIALMGLRLQFAFAALHASAGFIDTMPFVLASLLGSASSIAPAGLGVSESLAALAATQTPFAPGTAFLAVGLDRLVCLLACGCTVAIGARVRPDRQEIA